MCNPEFIEVTGNSWERIYFSLEKFKSDYQSNFRNYSAKYKDASETDFIAKCESLYKICLENVQLVEIVSDKSHIYSLAVGHNVIDEVVNYITTECGDINDDRRINAYITFKAILSYLSRIWLPKTTNTDNGKQGNIELIDLSDTRVTEKVIYLYELGIIDFLQSKQPFVNSKNALASILGAITGEKPGTIQSYINPINNPNADQSNNPLTRNKTVKMIRNKLLSLGFSIENK